jgi:hypothetical protein
MQMTCWFVGAKDGITDELTVSTVEIRSQLLRFFEPSQPVTGQ